MTNFKEEYENLQKQLESVPHEDRLGYIKCWMANQSDPAFRTAITGFFGLMNTVIAPARRHVVLLLHGIRTHAEWQERVRQILEEEPNTTVVPLGYEYWNAFRFWLPFGRGEAVRKVQRAIAVALTRPEFRGADVSIVAHSFGTFVLSQILAKDTAISFKRILLCGSIIPHSYRWEHVQGLPARQSILNEVGTLDVWPAWARSVTWGYGSTGSYGFKSSMLIDRFHKFKHSDFFEEDHVRKYWAPFICSGTINKSAWEMKRPRTGFFVGMLSWVPIKYALIGILALAAYHFFAR